MRKEVGVTPNGRGKVGVRLVGKAKVACIVWAVNSLLHGAKQQGLQKSRIGTHEKLLREFGVVGWLRVVAA